MKATLPWFAALLLAVAACTTAQAGPFSHCCHPCPPCPQANAFSPPCCCPVYCGPVFSNPLPPYPFNGLRPCLGNEGQGGGFPGYAVHPFAHSPRDFFMAD